MGTTILDTNIYISAFFWGGKPKQILRMAIDGKITIAMSFAQYEELRRVLTYEKFSLSEKQQEVILTSIVNVVDIIDAPRKEDMIKEDPSDNMILDIAAITAADCIVSGDNHLLSLKEYKGIPILTPSRFLIVTK